MKAINVLECIISMELCGEDMQIIDVPAEVIQDEEWWHSEIGGCPPAPIESGKYLMLSPNDARDWLSTDKENFLPDAEVEIGDNIVYLYKLEG